MAGTDYSRRRLLHAFRVAALGQGMPKHPNKPLSYLPVVLNVILRIIAVVLFVNLATHTAGILQVGVILFDVLILAPSSVLYAVGLFLAVRWRKLILEQMRQAKAESDLAQ